MGCVSRLRGWLMEALVTHQGLRARFLRSPGSWAIQPETLHICVRLAENGQGTGSGTALLSASSGPSPAATLCPSTAQATRTPTRTPAASPTSPSRTAEAHPGLSQGGKVVPVLGRGRAKDRDNRILHSPPPIQRPPTPSP